MNAPDSADSDALDGNVQPKGCNGNRGDILIVDDDLSALQRLGALLAREGYKVRSTASGEAALDIAREDPPELNAQNEVTGSVHIVKT